MGASVTLVVPNATNGADQIVGTTAAPLVTSASAESQSLPAGTNRSGTANTTASTLAAANTARRGLEIQNVGANNIGVNEIGGTASIGAAGTYTLVPGASMRVRTNRAISVIAATGATIYTATEW